LFTTSKISLEDFEFLKKLVVLKGSISATIESGSMEPLIMTGDKITISRIDNLAALKRFDIIVLWSGKILICHYVLHRNQVFKQNGENVIVTRGLRSRGEDLPVDESRILGRVGHQIPWLIKLKELFR
jgi:signal peptidase I